jgi:TP901 family phage tail tape measure protein
VDVAELSVIVNADTSSAERELKTFGSKVESLGSSFAKAFGVAAVAGVGAVAAGLGVATKEAMDFEKTISGVMAVGGKEAAGMRKELEALALQLGADTSFSAKEAAEGIEELVKAGVSLGDVMGGAAKASLDLAAAGGISVADAATIASNAMNTFNKSGDEMAHVADVIAGAANASAIDVGQFKFSLQAVGAVAATVGLTFEDTATAIAVLGQAGITGSDAGTSLKTMLTSLQPKTKEQTKLFKELGLMTKNGANQFFDATGKVKSMAEVSGVLQNALKGMTDQQKLATLQTLFGSDAIRAAAVLAKSGAAGFSDMAKAMAEVSAESVAAERLNNLSGSLEKLQGSLSTAAITIGLALTPALKTLVDGATDVLNAWMPTIQAFATDAPAAITATIAQLGLFMTSLGLTTTAIGTTLRGALTWLTATGWPLLQSAMSVLVTYVQSVLIPVFAAVWNVLAPTLQAALNWLITTGFPLLQASMTTVGAWITTVWLPTATLVVAWLSEKIGGALTWLTETAWPAVGNAMNAVQNWIKETLVPTLTSARDWLEEKLGGALTWLWEKGWPAFGNAMNAVQNWIKDTLVPTLKVVWDWLSTNFQAALTWLKETGWPNLQAAMTTVWQWIKDPLIPTLTTLWEWLSPKLQAALDWLKETGWPNLQTAMATTVAYIKTTVIPGFQDLHAELSKKGVYDDIAEAAWNIYNALTQINSALPTTSGAFGSAVGPANDFAGAVKNISAAFAEWSRTGPYEFIDNFNEAVYQIRWYIWSAMKAIRDAGRDIGLPGIGHDEPEPQRPSPAQRPSGGGGGGGGGGSSPAPNPSPTPPPSGGGGGGGGGGSPTPNPSPTPPPAPTPSPGDAEGAIDNSSRSAFVKTAAPFMLQAAGGNKELASMMLATAISENGSIGKGGPFWANNFFGIKGEGPGGSELVDTWEDYGNGPVHIKDRFAVFRSITEGMGGFMWFLQNNSRYNPALAAFSQTGNATQLYRDILTAGYATDKSWVDKVISIRNGQVKPVAGFAGGGWAGLRGPELALLGERGPEYVVPNHALSGMSAATSPMQTMRVDVAVAGRVAEEIYVTGRDLAIKRGRAPSWAV